MVRIVQQTADVEEQTPTVAIHQFHERIIVSQLGLNDIYPIIKSFVLFHGSIIGTPQSEESSEDFDPATQ
jgi:hypothetical protein